MSSSSRSSTPPSSVASSSVEDGYAAGARANLAPESVTDADGLPGVRETRAIAEQVEGDELVPDALDQKAHDAVAKAVQEAAERSGAARPELAATGL